MHPFLEFEAPLDAFRPQGPSLPCSRLLHLIQTNRKPLLTVADSLLNCERGLLSVYSCMNAVQLDSSATGTIARWQVVSSSSRTESYLDAEVKKAMLTTVHVTSWTKPDLQFLSSLAVVPRKFQARCRVSSAQGPSCQV